jgi:hypothetical protein
MSRHRYSSKSVWNVPEPLGDPWEMMKQAEWWLYWHRPYLVGTAWWD